MSGNRALIHTFFVLLLPLVVAQFGLSVAAAAGLVLLALLWRWLIVLTGIVRPPKSPEIVLETISASHFVEKVRWCMDRLGIEYTEQPWAGTLGAFFRGRTVPRLSFRTGLVRSVIGNSPEILRYLWGAYSTSHGESAMFLEPTADRLEFERRIDRYGSNLQVWIYYHLLHDRELSLHAWGVHDALIPWWQRQAMWLLFPLQAFLIRRAFSINDRHYEQACHHIEEILSDIDTMLADGRNSILGDESINYTDIAFAAMTGLWSQPAGYGAGKADAVRLIRSGIPIAMRNDVERWTEDYPKATAFVARLYADERDA